MPYIHHTHTVLQAKPASYSSALQASSSLGCSVACSVAAAHFLSTFTCSYLSLDNVELILEMVNTRWALFNPAFLTKRVLAIYGPVAQHARPAPLSYLGQRLPDSEFTLPLGRFLTSEKVNLFFFSCST